MWDESLIESRGTAEGRKKWVTVPLAFLAHAVVVAIIISASYWFVEAVQAPPIPVTLLSAPPPPPPPPPAAPKKKPETPKEIKPVEPTKEFQPTEVPENLPTPEENPQPENKGVEGGVDGGVEGGVEGGVPGGVLGGVPGGVIGGVPGGEEPIHITAEVKQPVLTRKVEPPYPEIARKARIQGVVILEAIITKTGTVEEVKVIRALHPILDQAAVNAVRQWKYQPAMLNGHPVKVYFTVTVNFTLK